MQEKAYASVYTGGAKRMGCATVELVDANTPPEVALRSLMDELDKLGSVALIEQINHIRTFLAQEKIRKALLQKYGA